MENSRDELVKALFHMAWLDEVVTPHEVRALTSVLRQLGYSLPEVLHLLDSHLCERPKDLDLRPLDEIFRERDIQLQALQALMTVCFSGGQIHPEQIGYIEGLILRMGLTAEELELLRQNALRVQQC